MLEAALKGRIAAEDYILDRIVQEVKAASGANLVILATIEPETGKIRTQAWAGLDALGARRALQAAGKIVPAFDPRQVTMDVHVNRCQEAVFLRGETVSAPMAEVARGVVPKPILLIAERLARIAYSVVFPLVVDEEVLGSLSFHMGRQPNEAKAHVLGALANQVTLAMENDALLRQLGLRNAELRVARKMVGEAAEGAHREIAELLHGPVQTQLLLAEWDLEKASALAREDTDAAIATLADVGARLRVLREQEIRRASQLLHPSAVELGIGPAARALAGLYGGAFSEGVTVTFDPGLEGLSDVHGSGLDSTLTLRLYRMIEEGLTNARKHSGATWVKIRITKEQARVVLTVQDNGRGFDPATQPRGLGLRGIDAYVADEEGYWEIVSTPGRGVLLHVEMPLTTDTAGETPAAVDKPATADEL